MTLRPTLGLPSSTAGAGPAVPAQLLLVHSRHVHPAPLGFTRRVQHLSNRRGPQVSLT